MFGSCGAFVLVAAAALVLGSNVTAQTRPTVTTAATVVAKAGRCPASAGGMCAVQCYSDAGCRGQLKCCWTACGGRVCTTPLGEPTTPATNQGAGATKPGQCALAISQWVCAVECGGDSECGGSGKCCRTSCGGKVCSEPTAMPSTPPARPGTAAQTKPGACKVDLAQFSCSSECQKDSDCRYDLKCCRTTCGGRMCSAPVATTTTTQRPTPGHRPGECPAAEARRPVDTRHSPACPNTCRRDEDCNRFDHKCCHNECGGRHCTMPVNRG